MNMNNRGFTLIELIVTILLLSIISIISFVAINGVIENNKVSNCKTLVNNIKIAAKEYVSDHRYDSGFSPVNNKINLEANELISDKYLTDPIYDPFDTKKDITNNISVSVTLNNKYLVTDLVVNGISCDTE